MENEPLHEAMQLKGTSMTHPGFSPNDEWANFELLPVSLHTWKRASSSKTSYVREAYKFGLRFQETIGANPFKFGLEGGGDDHGTSHTWEEFNYHGGHAMWTRRQGAHDRTIPLPGAAPLSSPALRRRHHRCLGRVEHPRRDLRRPAAQGDLRQLRRADQGPLLRGWDYPDRPGQQKDWVKMAYARACPWAAT